MVRAHLARRRGHVQQRHLHAAALDLQAALEHLAGVRLRVMISSTWRGGVGVLRMVRVARIISAARVLSALRVARALGRGLGGELPADAGTCAGQRPSTSSRRLTSFARTAAASRRTSARGPACVAYSGLCHSASSHAAMRGWCSRRRPASYWTKAAS